MSDCEYLTEPFDEEQQERAAAMAAAGYAHPAVRSYLYSSVGEFAAENMRLVSPDAILTDYLVTGGDSDSPDEATVKCTAWSQATVSANLVNSSGTESSSSSDEESDGHDYEPRSDNNYRTLTPSRRLDNSTRRDDDFKWMPTGDIVDDDVIEPVSMDVRTDEFTSASLDRRRRAPSDRSDRDRKSRSSVASKPPQHPTSVRASPRPRRFRDEETETPPELQRRWNSYEHFRWPDPSGAPPPPPGWWPPVCWCHGPPPPPCCMHDRSWPSHPSLPPARGYNKV